MTEEKTLKIKFKLNDLELELEGQQQTVKNEFEKFKTFINNHFLDPKKEEKKEETLFTEKELTSVIRKKIPSYKSIKEKKLATKEIDWVLLYCYVASKKGVNSFRRQNILDEYKRSRRLKGVTASRLSQYLVYMTKGKLISKDSARNYILLNKGISRVALMLQGMPVPRKTKPKAIK